jgi:hypothetical protein
MWLVGARPTPVRLGPVAPYKSCGMDSALAHHGVCVICVHTCLENIAHRSRYSLSFFRCARPVSRPIRGHQPGLVDMASTRSRARRPTGDESAEQGRRRAGSGRIGRRIGPTVDAQATSAPKRPPIRPGAANSSTRRRRSRAHRPRRTRRSTASDRAASSFPA